MANPKPKRRSRKRRGSRSAPGQRRTTPEPPASRSSVASRRQAATPFGPYGERPPSPFGGVPVSEIAIFAGGVGFVIGVLSGGRPALIVGAIVCAIGVLEVTAREHFTGYRSHSVLLAAYPTVLIETGLVAAFGIPSPRLLLLVAIVPVFAGAFWFLRARFRVARQRRIARLR